MLYNIIFGQDENIVFEIRADLIKGLFKKEYKDRISQYLSAKTTIDFIKSFIYTAWNMFFEQI